ncbi:hypothetical protein CK203_073873 [Vitis vinifera]|uniref:HPP transmembrane region domain-containing protein n=1 Tax=Vitis vinifera TaxID=29760 RepID=A0A438DJ31_VITVI|nr:hypothetical protein CK203_073873 [Vitis vinifera]
MGVQLQAYFHHHHSRIMMAQPPLSITCGSSNSLLFNGKKATLRLDGSLGLHFTSRKIDRRRRDFGIVASSNVAAPFWMDGSLRRALLLLHLATSFGLLQSLALLKKMIKGSRNRNSSLKMNVKATSRSRKGKTPALTRGICSNGNTRKDGPDTGIKRISMTIAPLGAVCAVLFATPSSPAARKYNMFMAQIGCAAIGVLAFSLLGPGWLARSTALGASIAFMIYTRSTHPPAASLPLLFIDGAKFHHLNFWYALFPGATACILLCLIQEMVCYLKQNFKF